MKKQKQKYNVYIRGEIDDCEGDPNCIVKYELFAGSTYAVSKAQAETQVRFRNGDKFNSYFDDYGVTYYKAILASEDDVEKHRDYSNYNFWRVR